jgi:hypothetical protein
MESHGERDERCEDCRWWEPIRGTGEGECHRFPPIRVNVTNTCFPQTFAWQWCGEFQRLTRRNRNR